MTTALNGTTTQYFLAVLQRGGTFGHYWTNAGRKSLWWPISEPAAIPSTWRNVYFGVHPTTQIPPVNNKGEAKPPKAVRSQIKFIAAINAFFGEFDAKDFDNDLAKCLAHVKSIDIIPCVIIASGNGYHVYWLLSEPWLLTTDEDRAQAQKLQSAWVTMMDSDKGAKDLARVLRVPGTENHKYTPPRPVTIVHADFELLYDLDDLKAIAAPFIESDKPAPTRTTSVIPTDRAKAYVLKALSDEVAAVKTAPKGSRHEQLIKSATSLGELIAAGVLDRDLAFNLLRDAVSSYSGDLKHDEQTILDGFKYGAARPRGVPEAPPDEPSYMPIIKISKPVEPFSDASDDELKPPVPIRPDYHCTDYGNAQRLIAQHGNDLRYVKAWGWLIWEGQRWQLDQTGEIVRRATSTALTIYTEAAEAPEHKRAALARHAIKSESSGSINAMISLAESMVPATSDDFDAHDWLLNCTNGTLDLRTGELRPHQRADMLTKLINVAYDPHAECLRWLAFLDRVFAGNAELIAYVQRVIGYTLTGSTGAQCMFIAHGTGANGKSVLINVVRTLLNEYAKNADASTFMAQQQDRIRSDIARLAGVRFVSTVELDEGRRLSEALVKQVTGDDVLTARFLNKNEFEFKPHFKLLMATNHKPIIRGTDYAIWRRIRLIPFTVTIPEAERDPQLAEKLIAELPGILAWAVPGCLDWQRSGLQEPAEVSAATNIYRNEMDVIGQFIEESCIQLPTARVACADLYAAYAKWCDNGGEDGVNQRRFGAQMTERGFDRVRGTGGTWHYIGISLTTNRYTPPAAASKPEAPPVAESDPSDVSDVSFHDSTREKNTKERSGKLDHLRHLDHSLPPAPNYNDVDWSYVQTCVATNDHPALARHCTLRRHDYDEVLIEARRRWPDLVIERSIDQEIQL